MKGQNMNDYQIRFLLQNVLGQKVRLNDPEQVIRQCIKLADMDMLSGGRFACDHFAKSDSKDRVEYLYAKLYEVGYKYTKVDKGSICNDLFWEPDEERHVIVRGRERIYKSYGLTQKLVNMTYKYLYIYRDYIGVDIDYSKCECPIDSAILDKIHLDLKWTNITVKEYEMIQKEINNSLNNPKNNKLCCEIGGLAYDDNWIND